MRKLILASEMINLLFEAIKLHGDLPVMTQGYECGYGTPVLRVKTFTIGHYDNSWAAPHYEEGTDKCFLLDREVVCDSATPI